MVYALAMAVEAVAALATGFAYDRVGARVLLVLPVLVALVPLLAFSATLGWVLVGLVVWGLAVGIQDSTVKALVADLVPTGRPGDGVRRVRGVPGSRGPRRRCARRGALRRWRRDGGRGRAVLQLVSLALLVLTPRLRAVH